MESNKTYKFLSQSSSNRIAYFEHDFFVFCIRYFPKYFTHATPKFLRDYIDSLRQGKRMIYFEGFRGCGKTTIARLYILRCIIYARSHYIMRYSSEQGLATDNLYNIQIELQTNEQLIADYGQLYYREGGERHTQKKRQSSFITENDIKVDAMSIGTSPRGKVHGQYRPDLIICDDLDTMKSTYTSDMINKNYAFFQNEIVGGLSQSAQIIILGNTIRQDGMIPRIRKEYNTMMTVYRVPLIQDGVCTRQDKYSQDDIDYIKKQSGSSRGPNYMLTPMTITGLVKQSDIKIVEKVQSMDRIYIGVDPAISTKQRSDGCAIVVVGYIGNNIYVLDSINLMGDEKRKDNIKNTIKRVYMQYSAQRVNYEDVQAQRRLGEDLQKEGVAVSFIKPNKDKISRYKEIIEHHFINQTISFFNTDGNYQLIDQLLSFGDDKSPDDLVDALVYGGWDTDTFDPLYLTTIW